MKRRQVLRCLGAAALAPLGVTGVLPRSLGVGRARRLERIGLQLYTVRDAIQSDFQGSLERVARIGFQEVELFDFYGQRPGDVAGWLRSAGLVSPSSHVDFGALRDPESRMRAIEAARTIGNDYLVCVWIEPEDRQSLEDFRRIADVLDRAGETCAAAGLTLAYHNHDFEFETMEGELPFDLLLARTDANLVAVEIDLYWITKGGADPFAYFAQYPGRFPLVHVKDMDDTEQQSFTEVGRGIIDFELLLAGMDGAGARHFYVEQDETELDPFEAARIGFEYLNRLDF